jgi:hypothetical protein
MRDKSIAVIAVHGVGVPQPGDTARSVADLLGTVSGETFTEEGLRLGESIPAAVQERVRRVLTEASTIPDVADATNTLLKDRALGDEDAVRLRNARLDVALSAAHVVDYRAPVHPRTYATVRLRSEGKALPRPVDVYEYYWADLAKASPSPISVAKRLVTFPNHLLAIARSSVMYADGDKPSAWWDRVARLLYVIQILLVVAVPVLNTVYLGMATVFQPSRLPSVVQAFVDAAIPGVGLFVALAMATYRRGGYLLPLAGNALLSIAVTGATFAALTVGPMQGQAHLTDVFAVEWVAVMLLALRFVASQLEVRREVERASLAVCGMALAFYAAGRSWHAVHGASATHTHRWTDETAGVLASCDGLLMALAVCWAFAAIVTVVFLVVIPLLWVPDRLKLWLARRRGGRDDARPHPLRVDRARLASDTASVGVALAFLAIEAVEMIYLHALTSHVLDEKSMLTHVPRGRVFLEALGSGMPLAGGAFLVTAIVLVLYVLVPSIRWEVAGSAPLRAPGEPPAMAADVPTPRAPAEEPDDPIVTRRLGDWLTGGLKLARKLVPLFVLSAVALPLAASSVLETEMEPIAAALDPIEAQIQASVDRGVVDGPALDEARRQQQALLARPVARVERYVDAFWAALSAAALAFVAGVWRYPTSINRLWPVMGILFDIDAYLARRPDHATPRARMFERFISLMHEIHTLGYERVILVSHSQGTVVTADALRLWHAAIGGERIEPRTDLITMGSPLLAIYSRFFPHLYSWVPRYTPGKDDALAEQGPEVRDAGVATWTNLYRSGDYIGRSLWPWPEGVSPYEGKSHESAAGAWREACLGAGAHMGYWRDPEVGRRLVALMSEASREETPSAPLARDAARRDAAE